MRGRGEDIFQGMRLKKRLLEAVAASRAHMLIGLGWVDGWGEGKVVLFRQGSVWGFWDLVGEDHERGLMVS